MSIKAMSRVWERSKQKGGALLLLLAIADYAHDDGTGAYPTIAKLAEKTRMSESNVHVCLRALVADGELVIHAGAGPRHANLYDLILPDADGAKGAKTAPAKTAPSKNSRVQIGGAGGPKSGASGVQNDAPTIRINRHDDPSILEPSVNTVAAAPDAAHAASPLPESSVAPSENLATTGPSLTIVPRATPKPNRYGEFIAAVRAADIPYAESKADAGAVTSAPPSVTQHLAPAYIAAYNGEWDPGGTGWLRDGLNARKVLNAINGYLAWRNAATAPPKARTAGRRGYSADQLAAMARGADGGGR